MTLKPQTNSWSQGTSVSGLRPPPHILLFVFYNLLYLAPLLLVYFWGFSEGGNEDLIGLKGQVMAGVVAVYALGMVSFLAGARSSHFLRWSLGGKGLKPWSPCRTEVGVPEALAIFATVAVFLWSKIALIPLGVYSTTYNLDMMAGGAWSFSAFCSETMLLMQILVLFSNLRRRVPLFLLLSVLNGINLLHGTRIFFIISTMIGVFYLYIRGHLNLKRIIIFGPMAFILVLGAAYAIYLSRMSSSVSGVNAAQLASPLVYEAVFSQFSIIGIVSHTDLWVAGGRLGRFLSDFALFTTPRFLIPDKESMLYITRFDYLSPKGAFNGYAEALLYFGFFFPLFYYLIGVFADWLYQASLRSSWYFVLYVYLSTDFFLHIMRDGLLIPLKMLTNAVQIVILLYFFHWLLSFCRETPRAPSAGGVPLAR